MGVSTLDANRTVHSQRFTAQSVCFRLEVEPAWAASRHFETMYRLMYRTWRTQCVGPCAIILLVWYITTVTFPEPPRKKIVPTTPLHTSAQTQSSLDASDTHLHGNIQSEVVNPHNFRYVINNPDICYQAAPIFVLFFIHSSAEHFHARKLIRTTWASVSQYQDRTVRTVFLLAQPTNSALQILVERENTRFHDIIQEDFREHYKNLTYKHIMGLKWINDYCPQTQFVVKLDDDTFVHIFRLVQFLNDNPNLLQSNSTMELQNAVSSSNYDVIYCSVYVNQGPRRDQSDKWYVSREEYQAERYPSWCEGFAYVTTPEVARKLYQASLTTPFFWIDDVYVTGILAGKMNVLHRQFTDPFGYNYMSRSTPPHKEALFLLQKYTKKEAIWRQIWNITSRRYLGHVTRTSAIAQTQAEERTAHEQKFPQASLTWL